jgi:hypothetical protein
VRVLDVCFHPYRKGSHGPAIAVARVHCEGTRATVELFEVSRPDVAPFDPAGLTQKLFFLVENAGPDPFASLTGLRSEFWSFSPAAAVVSQGLA